LFFFFCHVRTFISECHLCYTQRQANKVPLSRRRAKGEGGIKTKTYKKRACLSPWCCRWYPSTVFVIVIAVGWLCVGARLGHLVYQARPELGCYLVRLCVLQLEDLLDDRDFRSGGIKSAEGHPVVRHEARPDHVATSVHGTGN